MSAKTMSSLAEDNRNLRKQIGCMNGIFQIFDRHHFLTGRRISSHSNKRLLQGPQRQMDHHYSTKTVLEKGVVVHKEKPRISTESSPPSVSSSSCSSTTFSSLDFNRTASPETLPSRQISIPESTSRIPPTQEHQPSSTNVVQSHDLRDVVKISMYREVRSLSIKPLIKGERSATALKYIDSPRPSQQAKTGKPKISKDERPVLPRFSYDGRESREVYKSTMKPKELPRLSLDSKTGSIRAFESRLSFHGRDPHVENDASGPVVPLNQEHRSHTRTSSVVAKLMGLDALADASMNEMTPTIRPCLEEAFLSRLTSKAEKSKQNEANYSPHLSQNNPASPSSKLQSSIFFRKLSTCSRLPVEPAPWRQQESSQGSPKVAPKNRKAPTNTLHETSSVYGEIEKRITELKFKKSSKDLRALKQILEAMQKTREPLDDQRGRRIGLEDRCSDQNSNLSMWKNKKSYHQGPSIKGPCNPKQSAPVEMVKPAKMMDKVKLPASTRFPTMETSHLQRLQTRTPKRTDDLTPTNNNVRYHSRQLPTTDKKNFWSSSEGLQQTKSENCVTPGRSSGTVSPRLPRNLLRLEGQSRPTTPSASGRVKKQSSHNRKIKVKKKDQQLSDDQLSELSSETRYSSYQGDTASVQSERNNSLVSQAETEIISMAHSIKTNTRQKENSVSTTREHIPAVESEVTMMEQPSPISVLDNTFYCEDSPSPVKKISTVFQDESPSPDEAEWHLESLNHPTDCIRSTDACKYNQKLENMRNSVHALAFLNKKPGGAAAYHNGSLNPDRRYINKILLTSGLLKDSSFITTTGQLLSSHHLINPDIFHVLEQTEETREAVDGGVVELNDRMNLNTRVQRKIIFDMVDEILVRKVNSGRLFMTGKKETSPQGLLKEVHLEMDRVCRIPDYNLDEADETVRLLTADMTYQSEDWLSYCGEIPALVLDIERLIFKDLINEVIAGEVMDHRVWKKRHCKKLFSK